MAHFARLDENNKVVNVIVVDNSKLINQETGLEDETLGINFCKFLLGDDSNWVQTSYNSKFRGNFAGVGFSYIEEYNIFLPPKPYDSWIIDVENARWKAPIDITIVDDYFKDSYHWVESQQSWFSIKEYIYNKYAKDFEYSEIEEIVNTYNLNDNKITPIHVNENYFVSIEKVKNYLLAHMTFNNWNSQIAKDWVIDYQNSKYNTANTIYFALKKYVNDQDKYLFQKFISSYTDYILLEDINNWLIYRRDKII